MNQIFLKILQMNMTAAVVILAVLVIRLLLKRVPKIFSYALWLVVLFRLVCPVALESPVGIQVNTEQLATNIISGMPLNNQEQNNGVLEQDITTDRNIGEEQNNRNQVNLQEANIAQRPGEIKKSSTQNQIIASPVFQIMKYIWLCGVAVLLAYFFSSCIRLKRKLLHAKQIERNLYEMDQLPTPFVFGLIKPCIYLPAGIDGEERDYILAHERMHMKRYDYRIKTIAFLVVIVHWMNPLVWIAFFCMTKDMEMSCDEAVIRNYGVGIKKEYSSSLLHMAIRTSNLGIAPLAFGEQNVKGRIKNIMKYKKTGIGILIVCGCIVLGTIIVLTTNQSDAKNKVEDSIIEDTEQDKIVSGNISDKNQKGDHTDTPPIESVELSETDQFPTWLSQMYEWRTSYIGDNSAVGNITDQWETSIETPLIKDGFELQTTSEPYELMIHFNSEEDVQTSLQSNIVYLERDAALFFSLVENAGIVTVTINNDEAVSYSRQELEETYGDLWGSSERYDDFCKLYQFIGHVQNTTEQMSDDERTNSSLLQQKIQNWAEAFCDRDGTVILSMISDKAKQDLQDRELLDTAGGTVSFGLSSPWPMQPEDSYLISNIDDTHNSAVILYYAMTSEPHICVWQEKLTFDVAENSVTVTGEELNYLSRISTIEEYQAAYPNGINKTQMDYTANDLGEALNNNALLSSSMIYRDLFSPDTALAFLLNLSDDRQQVQIDYGYLDDGTNDVFANITFSSSGETITIKMIQPYGETGIWIPQDMDF